MLFYRRPFRIAEGLATERCQLFWRGMLYTRVNHGVISALLTILSRSDFHHKGHHDHKKQISRALVLSLYPL
jgi:hypothetical protein